MCFALELFVKFQLSSANLFCFKPNSKIGKYVQNRRLHIPSILFLKTIKMQISSSYNLCRIQGVTLAKKLHKVTKANNSKYIKETLVGLASLVLENNYFEFNDRFYRQKLGTAIGTKFAPAYANLFMTRLEERLLEASPDKPLIWMRFIDDVFFIWMHGEEKLKSFKISELKKLLPSKVKEIHIR